ncbi:MAG: hypothetical protein ACOZNI_21120 [Myxococcota bacterium]
MWVWMMLWLLGVPDVEARKVPGVVPSADVSDHEAHALEAALDAYEEARAMLARDEFLPLDEPARRVIARLDEARDGLGPHHLLRKPIAAAMTAADKLTMARRIELAREHFSELSRSLVTIARKEPRLREGRGLFYCPMVKGYPYWIQIGETVENPYMGASMRTCGRRVGWDEPEITTPS